MDGAAMLRFLRSWTWTDSSNYIDSDCMIDLNISYHIIEDAIVKKAGEKYFWNRLDADGVSGQSEYTFSNETTWNITGINKTYWVSVDYGGTGKFVKAIPLDTDLMDEDPSYYEKNASKDNPFFEIKDNSLFIYPTPTDGVSIIRHYASNNLIDLTSTASESNVFNGKISSKHHYLIPLWARYYGFIRRSKINEAVEADNEFERKLASFLSSINTRNVSAKKRQTSPWFAVNPL